MKTNRILSIVAFAMGTLFSACTESDEFTAQSQQIGENDALSFSAYVNRATRGGAVGEQSLTTLQNAGFGVFGYYTDNVYYNQEIQPNFMYNEKISYSGTDWTYPITKYWPNEWGTNAATGDVDRLTFFAYAPYVDVRPVNGLLTDNYTSAEEMELSANTGIISLSRSTDKGDPLVHYVSTFKPANCVDLMWGVVPSTQSFIGVDNQEQMSAEKYGLPYMNLYKPAVAQKVKFNFEHALAALNVQIDATVDDGSYGNLSSKTKIYVRSITFEGFAQQGTLNLNNVEADKPLWLNYAGNGTLAVSDVTIYDKRRDGREATSSDSNEKPGGLNPAIVQSASYGDAALTAGVTQTAVNLFEDADVTAPIYVIPNEAPLKVTIVYDVETQDDKILSQLLADGKTNGSVVENTITSTIDLGTANNYMEAGKKYTLKMHLGMTSVKFDAEVSDWDANTTPIDVIESPEQLSALIAGGDGGEISLTASLLKLLNYQIDTRPGGAYSWTFNVTDAENIPSGITEINVYSYSDQAVTINGLDAQGVTLNLHPETRAVPARSHRAIVTSNAYTFILGSKSNVKEIVIKPVEGSTANVNVYVSGVLTDGVNKEEAEEALQEVHVYRLVTDQDSADNLADDDETSETTSNTGYEAIYIDDTEETVDLSEVNVSEGTSVVITGQADVTGLDTSVEVTVQVSTETDITVDGSNLTGALKVYGGIVELRNTTLKNPIEVYGDCTINNATDMLTEADAAAITAKADNISIALNNANIQSNTTILNLGDYSNVTTYVNNCTFSTTADKAVVLGNGAKITYSGSNTINGKGASMTYFEGYGWYKPASTTIIGETTVTVNSDTAGAVLYLDQETISVDSEQTAAPEESPARKFNL